MAYSQTYSWTIIAYVGPQTSSASQRCVHLYPDLPGGARYHCATVWEERFNELPYNLGEKLMKDPIIPGTAPSPETAKTQGIWQPCPPFGITTWMDDDGKKTKKLAEIMGPTTIGAPAHSVPAGRSLEQAVQGLEWNPVPLEEVRDQFAVIAAETMAKLDTLQEFFDLNWIENHTDDDDDETPQPPWQPDHWEWNKFRFSLAWRDANDQYRVVRPALLAPAIVHEPELPDASIIENGSRSDFLEDVASQHAGITDEEHAKILCQAIGIKASAEEGKARAKQAKRIWLFATLCGAPFFMNKDDAKEIASRAYPEEVPF